MSFFNSTASRLISRKKSPAKRNLSLSSKSQLTSHKDIPLLNHTPPPRTIAVSKQIPEQNSEVAESKDAPRAERRRLLAASKTVKILRALSSTAHRGATLKLLEGVNSPARVGDFMQIAAHQLGAVKGDRGGERFLLSVFLFRRKIVDRPKRTHWSFVSGEERN